jgi:hypothetical protein
MIYWQCSKGNLAADGTVEAGHNIRMETYPILSHYLQSNNFGDARQVIDKDKQAIFTEWHSIVIVYSRRSLTKSSDKLPAISGIAAIYQEMTGASYLAGIWDTDIHRGLL